MNSDNTNTTTITASDKESSADPAITTMSTTAHSTKRRGEYMTKDDVNEDDADGGNGDEFAYGSFEKASENVLQQRRILRVSRTVDGQYDVSKRSNSVSKTQNPSSVVTSTSKNPFGSLSIPTNSITANDSTTLPSTSEDDPATVAAVFGSSTKFAGFGTASSASIGATPSTTSTTTSGFGFGGFKSTENSGGFFATTSKVDGTKPSIFGSATSFGGFGSLGKGSTSTPISSSSFAHESMEDPSSYTPATTNLSSVVNLPSDYELRSGEEDEIVLFSKRCKTFRLGNGNDTHDTNVSSTSETAHDDAVPSVPPSVALSKIQPTSASLAVEQTENDSGTTGVVDENETNHQTMPESGTIGHVSTANDSSQAGKVETTAFSTCTTSKTWHETGIGPLKVLQTKDGNRSCRLVQRRESTPGGPATIVILNLRLQPKLTTVELSSDKHVRVATATPSSTIVPATVTSKTSISKEEETVTVSGQTDALVGEESANSSGTSIQAQAGIFLFKFKLASEANELLQCLQTIIASQSTIDTSTTTTTDSTNKEE